MNGLTATIISTMMLRASLLNNIGRMLDAENRNKLIDPKTQDGQNEDTSEDTEDTTKDIE